MAARSTTAGEILHQHPRRTEGDLVLELAGLDPFRDREDVFLLDRAAVLVPKQVLQQHLHGERQPGDAFQTIFLSRGQAVIHVGLGADLEGLAGLEAVERGHLRIPIEV
jgi:hypothetical protein